ncbi:unnamed protein product [Gongylonema pulchrum]|uniref:Uncharacterized protein n=1 Tax=Gongylonema pulchrum TaxID=637853 RepID=A0A3P6SN32_9BILA|nr:unnamed protein product [Gongylonema pulchrum]
MVRDGARGDESSELDDMTLIRHDTPSTPTNDMYKTVSPETLTQQLNSVRLAEARTPGNTGFVYNRQQANAIAEEGKLFFFQKLFSS